MLRHPEDQRQFQVPSVLIDALHVVEIAFPLEEASERIILLELEIVG